MRDVFHKRAAEGIGRRRVGGQKRVCGEAEFCAVLGTGNLPLRLEAFVLRQKHGIFAVRTEEEGVLDFLSFLVCHRNDLGMRRDIGVGIPTDGDECTGFCFCAEDNGRIGDKTFPSCFIGNRTRQRLFCSQRTEKQFVDRTVLSCEIDRQEVCTFGDVRCFGTVIGDKIGNQTEIEFLHNRYSFSANMRDLRSMAKKYLRVSEKRTTSPFVCSSASLV